MLLKCTCSHCSSHLEFESEHIGTVVSCPTCSKPTKLIMMSPSQAEAGAGPATVPAASTLESVRANTCYPVLRKLITVMQVALLLLAASFAIFSIYAPISFYRKFEGVVPGVAFLPTLIVPAIGLSFAVFCGVLAFTAKQALQALVDIADCQLQQVARST